MLQAQGGGERVCWTGGFQGVPAALTPQSGHLDHPGGASVWVLPGFQATASGPQGSRSLSRDRLSKIQEVPLFCEAPTQRVPEGWGLGCLESSQGRGRRSPMKGLVDMTTLVSPVCWSKLGGDGEIKLAKGEGSGAAV